MTTLQHQLLGRLAMVRITSASFDKRFLRNISHQAASAPDKALSDKQHAWLCRLFYKYRRQIPDFPTIQAQIDASIPKN